MEYQPDNTHPKYTRITVPSIPEKKGLTRAMPELAVSPGHQAKHGFREFTGRETGLSVGNLGDVADILKLICARRA